MFGNNPKRGLIKGDGSKLYIQSIFRTIQGEAIYVGVPAVFIRCGGCNLACSFCDTEFESYSEMSIEDILSRVLFLSQKMQNGSSNDITQEWSDNGADLGNYTSAYEEGGVDSGNNILMIEKLRQSRAINLIVITGGEPMRQPIELLCQKLLALGYLVQIETNGVLFRSLPLGVEVICSPKVVAGRYLSVNPLLKPYIIALKFLVSTRQEGYAQVPEIEFIDNKMSVFVQAMDEYDKKINKANHELAVSLALSYGYRLSYQLHKALDIE